MTKEMIEEAGFKFVYQMHFGRLAYVRIVHTVGGGLVCTHTNTDGAIQAFSRLNYAGKLIAKKGV